MDEGALFPLRNGLRVQSIALAQLFERSFRSLYCCSDGLRCRGAAVKYLSHNRSRSFGSVRLIPSHAGTKQLAPDRDRRAPFWAGCDIKRLAAQGARAPYSNLAVASSTSCEVWPPLPINGDDLTIQDKGVAGKNLSATGRGLGTCSLSHFPF